MIKGLKEISESETVIMICVAAAVYWRNYTMHMENCKLNALKDHSNLLQVLSAYVDKLR